MNNRVGYVLVLGLLVVAAVFPSGSGEEATDDATVLEFWSWRVEDVAVYESLIERFEAQNPDIRVTFDPIVQTEYNTVLSAAATKASQ